MTKRNFTIPGIIFTLTVTIGFIYAVFHLFYPESKAVRLTEKQIRANQVRAVKTLNRIYLAQQEYIKKDWNGDGDKVYAKFFVHLFQSISNKGNPVKVDLIPKEIGFAMGVSRAVNGYYYKDLYSRYTNNKGASQNNHYKNSWAVAAIPAYFNKEGYKVFVTDHSGRIFSKNLFELPQAYPYAPLENGWKEVSPL